MPSHFSCSLKKGPQNSGRDANRRRRVAQESSGKFCGFGAILPPQRWLSAPRFHPVRPQPVLVSGGGNPITEVPLVVRKMARILFFLLVAGFGSSLVKDVAPSQRQRKDPVPKHDATRTPGQRSIFLGCNLSDTDLITVTANLAACGRGDDFLLDSPNARPWLKDFVARLRPHRLIPIGRPADTRQELDARLGIATEPAVEWSDGSPAAFCKVLFAQAPRVVVCPAQPRRTLLQAACLAGVTRAPLYVLHGHPGEITGFHRQLKAWHATDVLAVGKAIRACQNLDGVNVLALTSEQRVMDLIIQNLLPGGPIRSLVIANPADVRAGGSGMSALAPWIAAHKRAALFLTNETGGDSRTLVERAMKRSALRHADSLILVADLRAIPPERRPNPVPGKDVAIEMEPLTPLGSEPFSFATGRLFQKDVGLLALMMARQHLLPTKTGPLRALVVSNPAGGLPLLESFSRNTAKELRNAGYQTESLFGYRVTREEVRRLLPEQDIFLWEGHHSTLVRDYGLPDWPEPLGPGLIFLQSCLALCEPEALPLLERGAIGVIGTSTRTYSASGGACSLAFFDALLYEHETLGASLRQAKNFLLAYALLKEKRIGSGARLGGANLRSAWAFTLWGDPTLRLPLPESPETSLPVVRHEVHGNSIILFQPAQAYDPVAVNPYRSQMLPNGRLAGLVQRDGGSAQRRLARLLFAEVHLPKAPQGKQPRLHSRLPSDRYVFSWDPWRRCGYLLADPRATDKGELHFQVHWETTASVGTEAESVVRSP